MSFKSLILQKQEEIVEEWLKKTLELYPPESFNFLFATKDVFHNPVGNSYKKNLPNVFTSIINEDEKLLKDSLEEIIKIRAVQFEEMSEALYFFIILKNIIVQFFEKLSSKEAKTSELVEIFQKIDNAILKAGDVFLKDKELIYELKANEVKKRFEKVIDRLNQRLDEKHNSDNK